MTNDDLKAKMRAALDKKNNQRKGVQEDIPVKEKAHHGSEVDSSAPQVHRRKAGGGGA